MITRDDFIREIIANPADDTVRGVFADWLEDHGEPERAEFIRVQCELFNKPCPAFMYSCHETGEAACRCSDYGYYDALRKRERELWRAHRQEWARVIPGFGVAGISDNECAVAINNSGNVWLAGVTWRRGFVAAVRGPLAALLEHLPGMGAELGLVERAEATDVEPWVNYDRTFWGWWDDAHHNGPDCLSRELMDAMDADPRRRDYGIGSAYSKVRRAPGGCILFRTEADARDALSEVILAACRGRAALKSVTGVKS